jgi:hypothetical protein
VLHLGLEPEPLCYLETTPEALRFFEEKQADRPGDDRLKRFLGINYDCCHLAVEHEEPGTALEHYRERGIRISKLHLSSALKVVPTPEARAALKKYIDAVYFHQVVARNSTGGYTRYLDLDQALESKEQDQEWRIHFHIPLHAEPAEGFQPTTPHLLGALDYLRDHPNLCSHLEMETYTWEVLPPELKNRDVADQLAAEYDWTLRRLAERGLA